ncbi:DUF4347 domain-containing protein [Dasania marina]|uniref:DUF4347 domain-containing protein n=1 Tax=Dasania marina TaxID=471499 RepID=UPI0030DB30C9
MKPLSMIFRRKASEKLPVAMYSLEPLEPRLLMSADPLGAADPTGLLGQIDDQLLLDDQAAAEQLLKAIADSVQNTPIITTASPDAINLSSLGQLSYQDTLNGPQTTTFHSADSATDGSTALMDDLAALLPTAEDNIRQEVIFVDTSVEDYQTLLAGIPNNDEQTHYTIIEWQPGDDALAEITSTLQALGEVDAIHIVSHGNDSGFALGDEWLSSNTLNDFQPSLSQWREFLDSEADLLIYGCELAAGEAGRDLLTSLATITGADIAASDDLTGAAALGGDWQLEHHTGQIDTAIAINLSAQANWNSTLGPPGTVDALWLTTIGDVSGASSPGLANWSAGELLEVADPNLRFETTPVPATGTTDGTFTAIVDFDDFNPVSVGGDDDVSIRSMHYVSTNITVGTNDTFDLQVGDVLVSVNDAETLKSTNTLVVGKEDVFVFRPDTANDYSSGSFYMLLQGLGTLGDEVRAITLVEQQTDVGGTTLNAGTFLFTQKNGGGFNHEDILTFSADEVGAGTTSGTKAVLISGADIGISESISGLELIETDTTVAGAPLTSGNILVSIRGSEDVGDNNLAATEYDVFVLDISKTSLEGPGFTAEGNASLLFDGDDNVRLDSGGAHISGLTLVSAPNAEPVLTATGSDPTFTEGGAAASLFSGASADTIEGSQTFIGMGLTITNVNDGSDEKLNLDGTAIELTNGNSGITATNGLVYNVSVVGSTATVTITGGSLSAAATQSLVDNISYENDSDDPNTSNRVVTITSLQDSGGTANSGDDTAELSIASTVTLVGVNDEPTLTATASNPTFTETGVAQGLFNGASASTVESGQTFTAMTLTVSNVNDGSNEKLNIDGSTIWLVNTILPGFTANNGLVYSVSVVSGTATISLSGSLSEAETQTLVDNMSYRNDSVVPSTSDRVVTITSLRDNGGTANSGDNTAALALSSTVTMQEVNTEPGFSTTATDPTFIEGGAAASLFSGTSASTIELGQTLTDLSLTVTNVNEGSDEVLNIDGTAIALSNGNGGITANNSLIYSVSLVGSTATVSLVGGTMTGAQMEALVDGMGYQNNSDDPSTSSRVVTLANLKDSGGVANGGDDTAALGIASTVTVLAVNDEPTLTATASNPTFTEGGAAQNLFSAAAVDTIEAAQTLSELTLTVSNVNNGADEILNLDGTAIALTNSNSGITATNGLSYSVSVSGTTATITLSGGSINAAATQNVVNGISYQNNSEAPNTSNRVVTITSFKDSGGTANSGDDEVALSISSTVIVQAVNDVPTGSVTITGSAVEDQKLTANTSTISDNDGLGTFSYQWQRNGVAISGATGSSYTLGDADVDKAIKVVVSYTDGSGNAESLNSTATAAVANINDPLTGSVVVDGSTFIGSTVTANTSGLSDGDGLASFSYQWLRDGVAISGATGSSYLLSSDDASSDISVRVNATDSHGSVEARTSAAVAVESVFVVVIEPVVPEAPAPENPDSEESTEDPDDSSTAEESEDDEEDDVAAYVASETETFDNQSPAFDNLQGVDLESLTGFANEFATGDNASANNNGSGINVRLLNKDSALASAVEASVSGGVNTVFSSFVDPLVLVSSQNLSDSLDSMRQNFISKADRSQSILGGTVTATAGLSVGYVVWLIRSGVLLSSALSALPAWRFIDPLPILSQGKSGLAGGDDESLESIVANKGNAANDQSEQQTDNNNKLSH